MASSSGPQPNFAALNRGRHLCSAGRPSRWALAHISSYFFSLHNYFSFIIVSVCVAFIFHLIITKFTLYPLLDYKLYRIVPVYLLHGYMHTSIDAPYTYISCGYAYRASIYTENSLKYTSICIALYHDSSLKRSGMARVKEGSHSFTCHPHVYPQVEWAIPAFTLQPQSITALWLVLISRPAEGMEAELAWEAELALSRNVCPGKWLSGKRVCKALATTCEKVHAVWRRLFV